MEANNLRPGIKTTEFWITIISSVTGILVTLGYLTPQQADQLVQAIAAVIGGVLTISSIALYIYSRYKLKDEQVKSSTTKTALPIQEAITNLAKENNIGQYPR